MYLIGGNGRSKGVPDVGGKHKPGKRGKNQATKKW